MPDYSVVNSRGKQIFTGVNLRPGEILQMELAARNIRKAEFAESLGMKAVYFSELFHGKSHVGATTAIKLQMLLNIPA